VQAASSKKIAAAGEQSQQGTVTLDITLPHNNWRPRPHQMRLWQHLQGGGDRAMAVWHRRAGKDEICLHHAACRSVSSITP
jgi:hypothetical protein